MFGLELREAPPNATIRTRLSAGVLNDCGNVLADLLGIGARYDNIAPVSVLLR